MKVLDDLLCLDVQDVVRLNSAMIRSVNYCAVLLQCLHASPISGSFKEVSTFICELQAIDSNFKNFLRRFESHD